MEKNNSAEKSNNDRDRIKEKIFDVSQKIISLSLKAKSITELLTEAVSILGKAAEASRCYVFENEFDFDKGLCRKIAVEWVNEEIAAQFTNKERKKNSYAESGLSRWESILTSGESISGDVDSFPDEEKEFLQQRNIVSILIIPVFLDEYFWGFIGFDQCDNISDLSESEITALQMSALLIGNSLKRLSIATLFDQQQHLMLSSVESQSVNDVVKRALDIIANVNGIDLAAIYQYQLSDFAFSLKGARGVDPQIINDITIFSDTSDLAEIVYKGKPLFLSFSEISRLEHLLFLREHKITNLALFPLYNNGKANGLLLTASKKFDTIPEYVIDNLKSKVLLLGNLLAKIDTFEKFRENEIKYSNIIKQSEDGFLLVNKSGKIIETNTALEQIFGLKQNSILGKQLWELQYNLLPHQVRTPARYYQLKNRLETLLSGRGSRAAYSSLIEQEIEKDTGELKFIQINNFPIKIANERFIGCIFRDITDLKNKELELRTIHERYSLAQKFAGISTFDWNIGSNIIAFSDHICTLLENEKAKSINNIADFAGYINQPGRQPFIDRLNAAVIEEKIFEIELKIFTAKGKTKWVVFAGDFLIRKAENKRMLGVLIDITERKKAERENEESKKQYDLLAHSISDIIAIHDRELRFTYISPSIKKFAGYDPDSLIGKTPFEFIHPDSIEQVRDLLSTFLDNLKPVTATFRIREKNGNYVWVESIVQALFDDEGNVTSILSQTRNVNERIDAERKLLNINRELRAMNKTKDKLLSIITHDIKSPFAGILGYSEVLADEENAPTVAESRRVAKQLFLQARQVYDLIENLLLWSNLQTGTIKFKKETFPLNPLVNKIELLFKEKTALKQIIFKQSVPQSLTVFADPHLLESILRNLVSNSIKFSKKEDLISVSAVDFDEYTQITVKDTGEGIDDTYIRNFSKEGKVMDFDMEESKESPGLGLLLCKDFIDKHNGTVSIETEKGNGTTFSFTLPKQ